MAIYHRLRGDTVELARGRVQPVRRPDLVYVTSLYTWTWKAVWSAVQYYKSAFPHTEVWLGGINASLMPDYASKSGADYVHIGVFKEVEDLMPAYDLVPRWDGSMVFASKGCNRRCP